MKFLIAFIILFSTFDVLANVLEKNISCYDCSAFERKSLAISEAFSVPPSPYGLKINIIDFSDVSVTTYLYQDEINGSLRPDNYSITLIPTAQYLRENVQNASNLISTQSFDWPAGREGINSAFDLINHAQKNRIVDDWLHNDHYFIYLTTQFVSLFGGNFIDSLKGIPFLVKFTDGSEIYIRSIDVSSGTSFTVSYIEGSARDPDGNEIPTNINDFIKTFILTEGHVDSWVDNALRHGVNIVKEYTRTGTANYSLQTSCIRISSMRVQCTITPRTEDSINPY